MNDSKKKKNDGRWRNGKHLFFSEYSCFSGIFNHLLGLACPNYTLISTWTGRLLGHYVYLLINPRSKGRDSPIAKPRRDPWCIAINIVGNPIRGYMVWTNPRKALLERVEQEQSNPYSWIKWTLLEFIPRPFFPYRVPVVWAISWFHLCEVDS